MSYEQIQTDLGIEQDKRKRLRDALVKSLQAQGTQMVSGRAVPYTAGQGLIKIAEALINKKGIEKSEEITKELNSQAERERQEAIDEVMEVFTGGEKDYMLGEDETFDGEQIPGLKTEVEPDPQKAALMAAENPYTAKTAPIIAAMMKSKQPRGAYSQVTQVWNPETEEVQNVVVDTRGEPGKNVYTIGGQPYTEKFLSPKSPEAVSATAKAKEEGKGEAQRKFDQPKSEAQVKTMTNTLAVVEDRINWINNNASNWNTGFATLWNWLPLSDSRAMASEIKQLEAIASFETLSEMRQNSPTGGALGQVSNFEVELLKAKLGAIDPGAGEDALKRQMKEFYDAYNAVVHGQIDRYNQMYPNEPYPEVGGSGQDNDPLGIRQ